MTLAITHTKVSAIADDPAASAAGEVLPSDWNASHTLTGTIGVAQGGTGTGTTFTAGSVVFAGVSGVYSQDNAKLFWDDTNFILKAGVEIDLFVNSAFVKALYPVYNATGDNWFIGEAGNTTTTGARNMGMGLNALIQLSTGFDNLGIGQGAGQLLDVGDGNVAIGSRALQHATADVRHTAVGFNALLTMVGGDTCTAIGNRALTNLTGAGGVSVTAIGEEAGQGFTTGAYNTIIGMQAAFSMASGNSNTIIGPAFGGYNITSGNYNTLVGGWFGPSGAMSSVIALSDGAQNLRLDYGYTNAATWTTPAAICVTPVAVASLPTAGIQGRRHFVTNATVTTFASIVAGGGGNPVPVYDDGTNWRIG